MAIDSSIQTLPRIIRLKDAPQYLGMKKDYFNKIIRPKFPVIRIGKRGIGFDRLDLDSWVEHHKTCVSSPVLNTGEKVWDEKEHQVFTNVEAPGESTKCYSADVFAKALEQVNLQRRKHIWRGGRKKLGKQ